MAEPLTDDELAFLHGVLDLARDGRTADLVSVLDAGIPVDLTSSDGDSLLMLAAYHSHPDTIAALLARGADTARVNDRGQTALAAAVFRQDEASVLALLRAGADPALGQRSAFSVAEFFGLDSMTELLTADIGGELADQRLPLNSNIVSSPRRSDG